MKKIFTIIIFSLFVFSLSAQNVAMLVPKNESNDLFKTTQTIQNYSPQVELQLNRDMIIGRNMLISAGVMTVAGAALYGAAWGLMGETGSAASICSISGISLMGISVPFYIAGSVLYVEGKKAMLKPTACGFQLVF